MTSNLFERRSFLKKAGQSLLAVPALSAMGSVGMAQELPKKPGRREHGWSGKPYSATPKITLNARDYGATGDGRTNDRAA